MASVGDFDTQIRKHLHAPRSHQVAAGLVPGKGRLVGQGNPRAAASEDEGGNTSRRARTDHDRVVAGRAGR